MGLKAWFNGYIYAQPQILTVDIGRKGEQGRRSFECSVEDIGEISRKFYMLLLIVANRNVGGS